MKFQLLQTFHKYIYRIQGILIIILVLPTIYLLLLGLEIPIPYIMFSTLHKLILLSGELLFSVLLYKKYFLKNQHSRKFAFFMRDLLIINCVFLFPFIKYYTNPIRIEIPIINQARPYLVFGYFALLLATVLVLYKLGNIKQERQWLNFKIDSQQFQDGESEKILASQFQEIMSGQSRIPILGVFIKNIYREGAVYVFAFLVLAVLGLILRLWRLDGLPPYIDELGHLNAAKDLINGVPVKQIIYHRSLYIVTLPVALFFKLFGLSLWTARLPGVLVNVLALFPLYLLCKRINKPIALTASGLYVFSPWMIAASRNVREYAYYPLIFYGIGLIMVLLYEAMPDRIIFDRDYRLLLRWNILFYLGVLVFCLYFVRSVDNFSTLKVLLIHYPVFGVLLMRKIDWCYPKNIAMIIVVIVTGIVVIDVFLDSGGGQFLLINHENKNYAFFPMLFFERPAQQWYYNRPLISIAIFILVLLATSLWDKKKFVLPFALLTFLGGLLAFSFIFVKGERPRYAINIEFWYVVLMATGLFCAFMIGEKFLQKSYRWIAWVIPIILFWNIPQTLKASVYNEPGWHPITGEYHAEIGPALSYLQSNMSIGDAIVTTGYITSYENFYSPSQFSDEKVILYNYGDPNGRESIYVAIDTYENGWIVLDYPRGYLWSQPVPFHDFVFKDKQVEFLGGYGNVYMLRWGGK